MHNPTPRFCVWMLFAGAGLLPAQEAPDSSPHTVKFVSVTAAVKLEVLDWGGTGRPLILLAGMGNTAHIFDTFTPRFSPRYHVRGITRRGFGASSRPAPTVANYSATRLGDDVLAVMESLDIHRPVLIGHSLAGEELSSVGSRHPEKVAGLIYLDAGYGYAFYDRAKGDVWLDMIDLRKRIDQLQSGAEADRKQLWRDMLTDVAHLNGALDEITRQTASMPDLPSPPPIARAIQFGGEKYTHIPVPILAIFALPDEAPPASVAAHAVEQADAFQAGLPSARVVRWKNAGHYLFRSRPADVWREMDAFLQQLQ